MVDIGNLEELTLWCAHCVQQDIMQSLVIEVVLCVMLAMQL